MATTANDGHFGPLLPLARAALARGHAVRVAAPDSFATTVERAGFPHLPFADAPPELVGPVMAQLPTLSFDEANAVVVRDVFGRIDAQAALPAVSAAIEDWRPDVIVREPAELASLAAAVRADVPHVQLSIGMTEMSRLLTGLLPDALTELASPAELPPYALVDAADHEVLLSSVPEILDQAGDDAFAADAVRFRFRATEAVDSPGPDAAPLPEWGDRDRPLVYVTFGSVTGSLPPFAGVFRQALDGLADLPVRVLMTVGRRVDLAGLGPVPANARVESWWPQPAALAHADAVLGHGGFGTTMGAIEAGLPQVVAPIFTSDQVVNARHVASIGAGRAVSPGPDAVPLACSELLAVLENPTYRHAAREVAAAAAALPPADDAVALVERLLHP